MKGSLPFRLNRNGMLLALISAAFAGEAAAAAARVDFTVGLSYLLRPNTTVIAQYNYTNVDSNIPINSFTRNVGTLSLRFNF